MMKYIKIETQRVYSHGTDGMPKIEKIVVTLQDGFEFNKFLKYFPLHGYLNDRLKVVKVFDKEKEYEVKEWQKKLDDAILKLTTPEKTLDEKYIEEKQRNDELMERLAALEAKLGQPVKVKEEIEIEKLT